MKKYPGAWWGTRSGHRYYILLFNIPDISSASSSLPVSSLRVNEEGNCSESVLESREPGGTISGYRYYILVFYIQGVSFNWSYPKNHKYGKKLKYQNWSYPKIHKYGKKLKYQNWSSPKIHKYQNWYPPSNLQLWCCP